MKTLKSGFGEVLTQMQFNTCEGKTHLENKGVDGLIRLPDNLQAQTNRALSKCGTHLNPTNDLGKLAPDSTIAMTAMPSKMETSLQQLCTVREREAGLGNGNKYRKASTKHSRLSK